MYHGEVNVAQDELNSFLAVAEDLKVKDINRNYVASNSKPNHPGQPGKVLKYDAAVPSNTPTYSLSIPNQLTIEVKSVEMHYSKNKPSIGLQDFTDKDFFNVTLACGDEQIKAHKINLSANILCRNRHQHLLLYLNSTSCQPLESRTPLLRS